MAKSEKESLVAELSKKFRSAQSVILTDFSGLDVEADTELRRRLRKAGVDYRVVKNTLATWAARAVGLEALEKHLSGPTAIAFGGSDPISPAKIFVEFSKDRNLPRIKVGFWEGRVLGADEIKVIASLPGKETLRSQFLATLQGPMSNFMGLLNAGPQQFLAILDALADKKKP